MKQIKLGRNLAIFFLFFGVASFEAFQNHNWLKICFWIIIGFVFLLADREKKNE
jgi:hypothetical protein